MSQPGEDSRVALQKKTVLENKWKASKARLRNVIGFVVTTGSSPCAAPVISEQLDQAKKYMASVFDEMSAVLAPTEQDKLIEDFNQLEKIYNEARARLCNVERERVSATFPPFPRFDGQSFFKFFQSAVQFDKVAEDRVKELYLRQLTGNSYSVDNYFSGKASNIASGAAWEILEMKRMALTLLLERFRRCIFLLSFTGHCEDWKLLVLLIIRKCLATGKRESAEEPLKKVIRSLADPEGEQLH